MGEIIARSLLHRGDDECDLKAGVLPKRVLVVRAQDLSEPPVRVSQWTLQV